VLALAASPDAAARLGATAHRDAVALNARELPQRTLALLAGSHGACDRASDVEALTA
jgi:hypothetical protein